MVILTVSLFQAKNGELEKNVNVKDLKVSRFLEKSGDFTERIEALEKSINGQTSGNACDQNRIQIELLQPQGNNRALKRDFNYCSVNTVGSTKNSTLEKQLNLLSKDFEAMKVKNSELKDDLNDLKTQTVSATTSIKTEVKQLAVRIRNIRPEVKNIFRKTSLAQLHMQAAAWSISNKETVPMAHTR